MRSSDEMIIIIMVSTRRTATSLMYALPPRNKKTGRFTVAQSNELQRQLLQRCEDVQHVRRQQSGKPLLGYVKRPRTNSCTIHTVERGVVGRHTVCAGIRTVTTRVAPV